MSPGSANPDGITQLLHQASGGDAAARDHVAQIVYAQLQRVAGHVLRARRRTGDSIASTQLVNDVLMRLLGSRSIDWKCTAQFYAIAAREMRRIWIDYIRAKSAQKRGGPKASLEGVQVAGSEGISVNLLALDEVLDRLEKGNPRQVKVFEMLFFAGLTHQEAARALGVAEVTVKRDFQLARLWITEALSTQSPGQQSGHVE